MHAHIWEWIFWCLRESMVIFSRLMWKSANSFMLDPIQTKGLCLNRPVGLFEYFIPPRHFPKASFLVKKKGEKRKRDCGSITAYRQWNGLFLVLFFSGNLHLIYLFLIRFISFVVSWAPKSSYSVDTSVLVICMCDLVLFLFVSSRNKGNALHSIEGPAV